MILFATDPHPPPCHSDNWSFLERALGGTSAILDAEKLTARKLQPQQPPTRQQLSQKNNNFGPNSDATDQIREGLKIKFEQEGQGKEQKVHNYLLVRDGCHFSSIQGVTYFPNHISCPTRPIEGLNKITIPSL